MKIISLEIVNQRAIKAFLIKPDGDNVQITGDTGTGKTTAISGLWDLIKKRPDNLAHGAKSGRNTVKLSDGKRTITATRKDTAKTSTIDIKADDGSKITPTELKAMLSDLSVNPHRIMDMKPQERTQRLLNAADLGDFDLQAKDAEIDTLETQRLEAHRKAEALKPGDAPERVQPVDIAEAMQQKDAADKQAEHRSAAEAKLAAHEQNAERLESEKKRLTEQLAAVTAEFEEVGQKINVGTKYIADLPEPIDTAPIIERIQNAQQINQQAAAYQAWEAREQEHATAVDNHADLDAKVKAAKQARTDALDGVKWPIEGLTIDAGNVLYRDCLLENLGESEQMLVCAALAVSDIKSHPIHVVRMDGIESMSKRDFEQLTALFNKHDIQVLSSRVSRGDIDDGEIVISDGEYSDS
jgi:DNA repair exonuclease SbcCD ATPase subunit